MGNIYNNRTAVMSISQKTEKYNKQYATSKSAVFIAANILSSELLWVFGKTRVTDQIIFIAQTFTVHCICNVRKLLHEKVYRSEKLDKIKKSTANNRITLLHCYILASIYIEAVAYLACKPLRICISLKLEIF